ncbi:MAG: SDR family oxidoreductase [Flavobacteriales bacterium]|nr:SDR family oxidoreductase [Flavobacteriales bacterium]HPF89311.1 SDR family oxidoreductase [Flavobacteriales bacterium]
MTSTLKRPVLVTGGTGFIGSHVCEALIAAGHPVRCMDNFATSRRENISHLEGMGSFSFVESDIRSAADCQAVVEGMEVVVHLAALGSVPRSIQDPLATHATNLTGFLNMLEAARKAGVRRFVYASSSSVYGDSKELPKREPHIGRPLSPYAVTKVTNEVYAGVYSRLHGMDTLGLRFFNVFGERQDPEGPYAAAIPRFIRAFLRQEAPRIHGDGHQSRDFTYVGNVVRVIEQAIAVADARCSGEVFNVAFGARTSLLELVQLLREELARIDPALGDLEPVHVAERAGDVRDSLADISKARELLGYEPRIDLRSGLRKALPWYLEHWR